ncbi:MAG: Asp-tRNA(Asn)/Glu-tRNA(Gln) amidotransferase subunit GatA [Oscillospiraceae bacterium]|nr:Asp-tRNA(Asn)/Glu-tRNA(Gln) amidotransferase subunit GatA [Oscillospiraceae bacterium]
MNFTKFSLKQLRKSLDDKQISTRELALLYLERIKNNSDNAYISVTEEEALNNADFAQKIIDSGESSALTGIPCSIKDNICVAGIKTTCGSKMLEEFVPFYDAELIRTLKSQGYVLTGKTNMDEFAMGNSNRTSAFGNVSNPHDSKRVSGGSSGGSAAAVAAELCAYSIGTDTGGSIRQPAAHCGITGLKSTYGRISRQGVTAFAGSFDTVGALAKSAEDCAVVMESLCNNESFGDKLGCDIKGVKIALIKELFTEAVEVNVKSAVMDTVELLRSRGAEIIEVSIPVLQYAAPAYFALASAEGVSALSRFDGVRYGLKGNGAVYDEQLRDSRTRGFGEEVKRRIMLGNFVLSGDNMDNYFRKALAVKQQIIREYDEIFTKADAVVSPTSMRTAFSLDEPSDFVKIYSSTLYTVPANLAGLPSVSTPCGKDKATNLPIGVSITGKRFDESTILQIADFLEKATGFCERGRE